MCYFKLGSIYNPQSPPKYSSDTRLEQVFAIAQNISVSVAVSHGYGKHIKEISSSDWDSTMKVSVVEYGDESANERSRQHRVSTRRYFSTS